MPCRTITLLITLAVSLLVAPGAARAQPLARVPRIGYVTDRTRPPSDVEALRHALRELGYVEGHTLAVAVRLADTPEQYAALATELVDLKVDVIVARTGFIALAAQHAPGPSRS